jgi:hypothetical protein
MLDALARNMLHILQTVKELTGWGVALVPLPVIFQLGAR